MWLLRFQRINWAITQAWLCASATPVVTSQMDWGVCLPTWLRGFDVGVNPNIKLGNTAYTVMWLIASFIDAFAPCSFGRRRP